MNKMILSPGKKEKCPTCQVPGNWWSDDDGKTAYFMPSLKEENEILLSALREIANINGSQSDLEMLTEAISIASNALSEYGKIS